MESSHGVLHVVVQVQLFITVVPLVNAKHMDHIVKKQHVIHIIVVKAANVKHIINVKQKLVELNHIKHVGTIKKKNEILIFHSFLY